MDRLHAPIEVAQVSAAAAARLAVVVQSARVGWSRASSAPRAAGPPLARTCQWSRRCPLASPTAGRGGRTRDTPLLETKKAPRTAAPGHPALVRTPVPTRVAARAPVPFRAPARHPAAANPAASTTASAVDTWWRGA